MPFLLLYLFACNILIINFILLEYFVDDGCIHPLLVNFFYRQVDYLLECQGGVLLIILSVNN